MQNGKAIVENQHSAYIPAIPLLVIKTSGMKINNQMQNYLIPIIRRSKGNRKLPLGHHTAENVFDWILKLMGK